MQGSVPVVTFAFFGLWETTLAVGAAAASIPIIIHLLNRRRYQVVTWAAMRFLLNAQKKTTRKMRLEQLVLLVVRTLLVVLIVLAMASVMPWAESAWATIFPEGAGFLTRRATRNHKIIVLDASLSMSCRLDDKDTCFDRARDLAVQVVNQAQAGDGFHLLVLNESCEWVGQELSNDTHQVAAEIRASHASHGNGNTVLALKKVADKLEDVARTAPQYKVQEVYFVTDLQRATWQLGGGKNDEVKKYLKQIQKYAQTVFVDVSRKDANNAAVVDLALSPPLIRPGHKVQALATIHHYGQVPRKQLPVKLRIGRGRLTAEDPPFEMQDVQTKLIELAPGESKTVDFICQFVKPGNYAVQVQIGDDDLKADNTRSTVVRVKDEIPVLMINGRPAEDLGASVTEYLRQAIMPDPATELLTKLIPFRPKVIDVAQLSSFSESNLAEQDCIFLCDVPTLSLGQVHRLENHLKRGGGLVVTLGKEAAANLKFYNDELYAVGKGILPAKLTGAVQAPKDLWFSPQAATEAYAKPPLKNLDSDIFRSSLLAVRFDRYVQAVPAVGVTPTLSLSLKEQPGATPKDWSGPAESPLLLEWNPPLPAEKQHADQPKSVQKVMQYPGKVVLITTSCSTDWGSWPGSPSFGALVQQLMPFAVSGKVRERSYLVGQPLEEYLLSAGNRLKVTLTLPDPQEQPRPVTTEGEGEVTLFQWPLTNQGGVYRMTVGHDPHDYLFAVNPPMVDPASGISESELGAVSQEDLKRLDPDWEFQVARDPSRIGTTPRSDDSDVEVVEGRIGPEIAHTLLLGVLGLVILEIILAWAFGHFTSIPGAAVQESRIPRAWPVTTALVAGVLFLGIAAVLFHAAVTGDFLGFLPETFRSWIEVSLNIPAPAAGEGTRWDLDFSPFLTDAATDPWLAGGIVLGVLALLILAYRHEGPTVQPGYKFLMGGLRLFVVLMVLAVLLPQLKLNFKRQGWPHVILLIDDSLSMGESDQYQDPAIQGKVASLAEIIRANLQQQLPDRIKHYQQLIQAKQSEVHGPASETLQDEIKALQLKIKKLEGQLAQLSSSNWNPSRLQLAQALVKNGNQDWINYLLHQREMKIHVYHLDAVGKALALRDDKGNVLKVTDTDQAGNVGAIDKGIADLQPYAQDTQLGTAVRQILDQFRGSSISAVILLTDGITTSAENYSEYDKDLVKVSEYAEQKGVPLYLVGIGDFHELRDLKLHDLVAPDSVYVNDTIVFQAQLTGKGYKNLSIPVVLKIREKDGTETEVARIKKEVDPEGKPVPVELKYQPKSKGKKLFIMEVIPPEAENEDHPVNHTNLKLQRLIDVKDPEDTINVLYVEGGPRYEFRFLKTLLEREAKDKKGKQSINLKVFLVEGDDDFHSIDTTSLPEFPFAPKKLKEFDVIIFGDVNPKSPKMGEQKLKAVADFVRDHGGGLLMIAGQMYSPHAYKNTPLAEVMPIEIGPAGAKPPSNFSEGYHLELTPVGSFHPIFRFDANMGANQGVLQKLAPMYWHAQGYTLKPLAEVLAVYPDSKQKTPLAVQQFVGAGRSMFFGFDETWRWRFRKDEPRFAQFWIQTIRYLSKKRVSETTLRLDRQTPYPAGDKIKVIVSFPDNLPPPKQPVKVLVQYTPPAKKGADKSETTIELAKVEGSWATYEGFYQAAKEGKYHFRLISPLQVPADPAAKKDKEEHLEPPSAEAEVVRPPGELERLRMNKEGMEKAAQISGGKFYTLATADQLPLDLPSGFRVVLNTEGPPHLLWNHWLCFLLLLGLLTSEWLLRKRKHLL